MKNAGHRLKLKVSLFLILLIFFNYTVLFAKKVVNEDSNRKICSPTKPLYLSTTLIQSISRATFCVLGGYELWKEWHTPLSGIVGNLNKYGKVYLDYYFSKSVFLQIRGAVHQVLRGEQLLQDAGDFTVSTVAEIFSETRTRPSFGLQIKSKLPNTNQNRGIGPNTTDLTFSILMSKHFAKLTFMTEIGVGILTAPQKINLQNDVLVYGVGWFFNLTDFLIVSSEINGFLSTVKKSPIGTESRGRFQMGLLWKFSNFALEIFPSHGLNNREGDFGIGIGVSTQLNILTNHDK
jgi:hypothetical protein